MLQARHISSDAGSPKTEAIVASTIRSHDDIMGGLRRLLERAAAAASPIAVLRDRRVRRSFGVAGRHRPGRRALCRIACIRRLDRGRRGS